MEAGGWYQLNSSKEISETVHLDIMILLEKYPYVAQIIAGNAQNSKNTSSEFSSYRDPLLAPMQHIRQKAILDVINKLNNWVNSKPGYGSAFDGGLDVAGRFYSAIELCKAINAAVQEILEKPSILISKE